MSALWVPWVPEGYLKGAWVPYRHPPSTAVPTTTETTPVALDIAFKRKLASDHLLRTSIITDVIYDET